MTEVGKYLYCILRGSGERTFDGVPAIGSRDGPVHTVFHDGLAVVVSDSPVQEYDATRTNMLAHERVQERVMQEYTLLPVRFGTVTQAASPGQDLQKLLAKRGREFSRLLDDMEDKMELGLKAYWRHEQAIYEEILAENRAIRKLRNSLRGKPPQATHYDRIRLGEMVKEALGRKKTQEAAGLLHPLSRLAHRVQENETIVDRMIVNAAFLVEKGREEEFDRAVHRLEADLGQRLAFKYVGPTPPWNFVNIVVNWEEL